MRIGIDIRPLSEGKMTGVEVYTLNLLQALFELDRKNQYVLFSNSFGGSPSLPLQLPPNVTTAIGRWPNRLLNAAFRFAGWPYIDRLLGGLDIFFSPRYLFTALSPSCRLVMTVHDLSFIRHPEFFSWQRRWWHRILSDQRGCRRADRIIAVSESTKRDLIDLFRISNNKISVVYPGVNAQLAGARAPSDTQILSGYGLGQKPFILFLGTIEPRKNVAGIIAAYTIFRSRLHEPVDLVMAGGLGWLYRGILKAVKTSTWRDSIYLLSTVDEPLKAALLHSAALLVFPSFYEGFGFPPLEAMAAGTPVVASYNSSFPEVLGDSCLYVNPYNPWQLAGAMETLLSNSRLRSRLIAIGKEQVERFSWQLAAEQTLKIFESY